MKSFMERTGMWQHALFQSNSSLNRTNAILIIIQCPGSHSYTLFELCLSLLLWRTTYWLWYFESC